MFYEKQRLVSLALTLGVFGAFGSKAMANEQTSSLDVDPNQPVKEVISSAQVSDINSSDWAFQALASLAERYDCTLNQDKQPLSRDQFAAKLNVCLDKIKPLIADISADLVKKEDLQVVNQLQAEFAPELANLPDSLDKLSILTGNDALGKADDLSQKRLEYGINPDTLTNEIKTGNIQMQLDDGNRPISNMAWPEKIDKFSHTVAFLPVSPNLSGKGEQEISEINDPQTIEKKSVVVIEKNTVAQQSTPDTPSEIEPEDDTTENQETPNTNKSNDWHFLFQPYGTIPITTYGNATVKGRTVDYQEDLGSLLEVLQFTISGRGEAWKGNLGFIVDAYYVKLGASEATGSDRFPNISVDSTIKLTQGIYDFALSYNLGDEPMYNRPDAPSGKTFPRLWFQPIIGARLNSISTSIGQIGINVRDRSKSFDKTFGREQTWIEPMLGAKLGVQVSDSVVLWARGDVSGFGLAADTDLSWNIFTGVDLWVSPTVSLQMAYRFYQIKYKTGSGNSAFGFEENLNGPVMGATFHF